MVRVVGIDVSRGEAICCVLEEQPQDLLEFARSYKPIKVRSASANSLIDMGDVFILEPTGSDHRIFSEVLRSAKKPVLGVTGIRVRGFAKNAGILNKSDREDAAVIAAYGLQHLEKRNPKAFINITASEFKEHYLALQGIKKQKVSLANQVRGRLTYECPELHDARCKYRDWGDSKAPRFWRAIAGQVDDSRGLTLPEQTLGRGISTVTQQMAIQICNLELLAYAIECECEALIQSDRFSIYQNVFSHWGIKGNTAIAILAAIFPIEQYLEEDGRQTYKRVHSTDRSKHQRTTRNRSLKQFKRAIGAGLMWIQSGKKEFWAPTGDKAIRASLYAYLEATVCIRSCPNVKTLCARNPELKGKLDRAKSKKERQKIIKEGYSIEAIVEKHLPECKTKTPWKEEVLIKPVMRLTEASDRIAELQLFYKIAPQCLNKSKSEKIMKVYPRFVTKLFRDLTKEYQEECNNTQDDTKYCLSFLDSIPNRSGF
ncbi:MAG: transposase [Elainellaceae cyanobacterium]